MDILSRLSYRRKICYVVGRLSTNILHELLLFKFGHKYEEEFAVFQLIVLVVVLVLDPISNNLPMNFLYSTTRTRTITRVNCNSIAYIHP
jgi:hypothetical protein